MALWPCAHHASHSESKIERHCYHAAAAGDVSRSNRCWFNSGGGTAGVVQKLSGIEAPGHVAEQLNRATRILTAESDVYQYQVPATAGAVKKTCSRYVPVVGVFVGFIVFGVL